MRSSRSPTGRPTEVRHWLAYHNPDVMGFEFYECEGFAILTNKRVRDLVGDIVWDVGRLGGTTRYFLDCRFRVTHLGPADPTSGFSLRVSGDDGLLFGPALEITAKPWFEELRRVTGNFSVGFQSIKDSAVRSGLSAEYDGARAIQRDMTGGAPQPLSRARPREVCLRPGARCLAPRASLNSLQRRLRLAE